MAWDYAKYARQEMEIIKILRKLSPFTDLQPTSDKSVYDAGNKKYRVEIKDRNGYFEDTMIDQHKIKSNYKVDGREFIYVVRQAGKIYIFNVDKLIAEDYDFGWEYKDRRCHATGQIKTKISGYINVADAKGVACAKTGKPISNKGDNNDK